MSGEEHVFVVQRAGADVALDRIVIDLNVAFAHEQTQATPIFGNVIQSLPSWRFGPVDDLNTSKRYLRSDYERRFV